MSDILKWTSAPANSIPDMNWQSAQDFPSPCTSAAAPALTVFQDKLWCMHRGGGDNVGLWYLNYTSAYGWSNGEWEVVGNDENQKQLSPIRPTLAANNRLLWCAYRGTDNFLYLTWTSDGQKWTPAMYGSFPTSGPAVAMLNDQPVLVYSNRQGDNNLWAYVLFDDGNYYSSNQAMGNNPTSRGSALAAFKNQLWCVYRGDHNGPLYVTTSSNGQTWTTPNAPITDQWTDGEPALVYVPEKDVLLCVYGDGNGGPLLWYTYTTGDPNNWSRSKPINGIERAPGTGVGLADYQGNIFCVYRSA